MANLELRQVRKSYGATQVIHGIDLEILSGEFCVFVGPSGCGKSTLLRMIAGLEEITAGEVVIDGEVVNTVPAERRGLAMVFQSYALYPHMSVRNNLAFGLENLRMDRAEIDRRVAEAARMLQIERYLKRRPGQLSGGQRQRVAIGRAVVREPRVFLFDEPLSNLDAELRVTMRGEISELHQRLGNTMIYVTHDQVEAMTMADKIAVLRDGQLEQFGPPLDLFNAPVNTFVAGFIGSPRMNMLNAALIKTENGTIVRLQGGANYAVPERCFRITESQPVTLGIRPADLQVGGSGGFEMRVNGVEQLGTESFLFGRSANDEAITVSVQGQTDIRRGDTVLLNPDMDKTHLFDAHTGESLRQSRGR